MKKALLALSCIAGSIVANQDHTHKIVVTVNFETSPKSAEQWNAIQSHFDQFLTKAHAANQEDNSATTAELLGEIEKAITSVPTYCKEQNISGSCSINLSITTPEECVTK